MKLYSLEYDHENGRVLANGQFCTSNITCCSNVYFLNKELVLKVGEEYQTDIEIQLLKRLSSGDRRYFPKLIAHGVFEDHDTAAYYMEHEGWGRRRALRHEGFKHSLPWMLVERVYRKKRRITWRDKSILMRLCEQYNIEDLEWDDESDPNRRTANWFIDTVTNLPVIVDAGCSSVE